MKFSIGIMIILALCNAGNVTKSWNFDDIPGGSLPVGWKIEATGQDKATAKWLARTRAAYRRSCTHFVRSHRRG